jgi:hypothetical protein
MLDDATDGGGQQLACPQSPKNGRTAQTPPKSANDRQTGHSAPSGHFCDDASQGRHRRHVPSMSTVAAIALIGVGEFFAAPASRAVADEIFDQMAGAIAAYDASSKTCYYEDAVGPALNKLDQYLSTYRKMGWQAAKSQGGGALEPLKSMGSMLGGTECQSYGLLVGAGLASGIAVIGFDPAVIEAMDRLFAKSGGRALERAESQVPPVSSGAALGPTLNDARAEETVYNCTISVGLNSYSPHQCSFAAEEGKIRIGWPGAETRRLWLDLHVSPPRPAAEATWSGVDGKSEAGIDLGQVIFSNGCWANTDVQICFVRDSHFNPAVGDKPSDCCDDTPATQTKPPVTATENGPVGQSPDFGKWILAASQGNVEHILRHSPGNELNISCDDDSESLIASIFLEIEGQRPPANSTVRVFSRGGELQIGVDEHGVGETQCMACSSNFKALLDILRKEEDITVATTDGRSLYLETTGGSQAFSGNECKTFFD